MSTNIVIKWVLLAATFVVPFILYLYWHHRIGASSRRRVPHLLRHAVGIASWLLALIFMFKAQGFHEREWFATHDPSINFSEEDMLELGDYPNVFGGWFTLGWIPVFAASRLARFIYRNSKVTNNA